MLANKEERESQDGQQQASKASKVNKALERILGKKTSRQYSRLTWKSQTKPTYHDHEELCSVGWSTTTRLQIMP
jgi:hypothetical protein